MKIDITHLPFAFANAKIRNTEGLHEIGKNFNPPVYRGAQPESGGFQPPKSSFAKLRRLKDLKQSCP